jgi:hypothetical protein
MIQRHEYYLKKSGLICSVDEKTEIYRFKSYSLHGFGCFLRIGKTVEAWGMP